MKLFLAITEIEIPIFATHSVRSGSTSKANIIELSIEDVQKAPG